MIRLTQLNGTGIFVNYEAIEFIEEVPHTIITTLSNNRVIVRETAQQIIDQGMRLRSMAAMTSQGV